MRRLTVPMPVTVISHRKGLNAAQRDDVNSWIKEAGFDINDIFEIDRDGDTVFVSGYQMNAESRHFKDEDTGEIAYAVNGVDVAVQPGFTVTVRLRWPAVVFIRIGAALALLGLPWIGARVAVFGMRRWLKIR